MTPTPAAAAASANDNDDEKTKNWTPPPMDNELLRQRIVLGGGTSIRGSLTKCAIRYRDFLEHMYNSAAPPPLQQQQGEVLLDVAEAIEESKQALERELRLNALEFHKLFRMVDAMDAEQTMVMDTACVEAEICRERRDIEGLQQELQKQEEIRQHLAEFEALARVANQRVARRVTEHKRQGLQANLKELTDELEASQRGIGIREKQFQLLLQCMLDLKSSLQVDDGTTTTAAAQREDGEEREEGEEPEEESATTIAPMDTTL